MTKYAEKQIYCEICGDYHMQDSYGWVQSCKGYFPLTDFEHDTVIHELKNNE